jgi:thioredoxin reductase
MKAPYSLYDVIIIGGSYAGLSAAMTLGRARRTVLLIDNGKPCNRQTPHAHNLITHDGDTPAAITQKAKEQVAAYPTVTFLSGKATHLSGETGSFKIETETGLAFSARKIILATGVQDIPLPLPGFSACWGISVLHCPYCHGYEVADTPLGIIANGETAFELTRLIHQWSNNLTLFTNGVSTLTSAQQQKFHSKGIEVVEKEIDALVHENGYLQQLTFKDGSHHPLRALFARGGIRQPSFIAQTSCALQTEGMFTGLIQVDDFGKTTVPGIYAAGDNATPMRSLSTAMAAGMKAGAVTNHELIIEDF